MNFKSNNKNSIVYSSTINRIEYLVAYVVTNFYVEFLRIYDFDCAFGPLFAHIRGNSIILSRDTYLIATLLYHGPYIPRVIYIIIMEIAINTVNKERKKA